VEGCVRRIAAVGACWTCLALTSCTGPFLVFPGGRLAGPVATEPVTDWSFVENPILALETRPADPYSVELRGYVVDGKLYLDPAEGRRWLDYMRADPNVRVRVEGRVHSMRAVLAARPGEMAGFDPTRFIYRLDPRPTPPAPETGTPEPALATPR